MRIQFLKPARQRVKSLFVGLALLHVCAHAFAESLEPGVFVGQPQILLKDGKVEGCGLRFGVTGVAAKPTTRTPVFDASLVVYSGAYGLAQVASFANISAADMEKKVKPKQQKTASFSFKVPEHAATVPLEGKSFYSPEDGKSLLYGVAGVDTLAILTAAISGEEIQLSVAREGERARRTFRGTVALEDEDKRELANCVDDLVRQMEARK